MKKQIVTIIAAGGFAAGAFAQGSIYLNGTVANDPGITTQGANAISTQNASTYFQGTIDLTIYYATTATTAELNAINAELNVTGGASTALGLLATDGFSVDSSTVSVAVSSGSLLYSVNSGVVDLNAETANDTPIAASGYLALVATYVSGTPGAAGYEGVIAFANSTGGNPSAVPAGTAASLTGWGADNQNLVLSAVPEPGTMALSALGGLSLFFFRRKN